MSLNEANKKCGVQHQQEMVAKTEPADVKFEDSLLIPSTKVKCDDGQNDSSCDQTSELNNCFQNTLSSCPVKQEPEDSQDDFHQVQAKNVVMKEEIDIEEHKLKWELIGRSSILGIFKDGLDGCDSVQENVIDPGVESKNKGKSKYNCAHCSYKTNWRTSYVRHYKSQHERCTEMYKCNVNVRINSYLTQHKYKHLQNVEVYKCTECSYEARRKDHLIQHYKCKHLKNADVYKCRECSYQTRIRHYLTKHHKRNHAKEAEVYKCDECSFETKYKSSVEKHYKYKHSKDVKVYKCAECSFETKYKRYLTRHYKNKHSQDAEVYKCRECSFETKIKYNSTQHKCKRVKEAKLNNCQEPDVRMKLKLKVALSAILSRSAWSEQTNEVPKCE